MRPFQAPARQRVRVGRVTLTILLASALALVPSLALASDDDEDEPAEPVMQGDRECYSGVNFAAGFALDPSGSFSPGGGARIGCRAGGYFGLEVEVEGLDEFAGSPHDRIYGFGGNALVFLPLESFGPVFDRLQIFGFGGIDWMTSRFVGVPEGEDEGTAVWSAGTGFRFYIDETFALDLRGKYVNHVGSQRLTYTQLDIGFTYDFYTF